MDTVFRALANPSRRRLLDRLYDQEGQTLGALCGVLDISRVGVMQHLKVLRSAGLITIRHVGRETFHYLNPVPIQEIQDRWISRYTAPLVRAMTRLKAALEVGPAEAKPSHVFVTYIRTSGSVLWAALTDPDMTERFYYGQRLESDLTVGSGFRLRDGARIVHDGTVLAIEPGRRLVHSFKFADSPDPPSRVTWEIEQKDGVCKLTVTHDAFETETQTWAAVKLGWFPIFAGLKTVLETGAPLDIPAPLRPRP